MPCPPWLPTCVSLSTLTSSPHQLTFRPPCQRKILEIPHIDENWFDLIFPPPSQDEQVNSLPGTLLDPSSIIFEEDYRCEDGEVVIDQQCVPCPPATYYDLAGGKKCTKCPIGQYNSESARLACNKCPIIQDKEGVTESEGATAVTECKEMCEAGHYLDQFTELCLPCGHGRYQESKGKFGCDLCEVGKTTRTKSALSKDECRDDCPDGQQLSFTGECETCPVGTYRTQGLHRGCQNCQSGRTSLRPGSTSEADCSVPVCVAGQFLNATDNQCQACPIGTYQPEEQQTQCIECPANTSTDDVGIVGNVGATSRKQCTNPCTKEQLCDKNAHCLFKPNLGQNIRRYQCSCKQGYKGNGTIGSCVDNCLDYCMNDGTCVKKEGKPYCQCAGSFNGKNCEEKSEFAYIAGGIAGAVLFIIVLVLLIWMICVRSGRGKRSLGQEKFAQPGADGVNGSQVNFYYGAPAPYAESIAPSQHGSTYAHYYEDEEDGWGMPNFYDTYGKNSKIARSNGSLYNAGMYAPQYGPQGEVIISRVCPLEQWQYKQTIEESEQQTKVLSLIKITHNDASFIIKLTKLSFNWKMNNSLPSHKMCWFLRHKIVNNVDCFLCLVL